MLVRDVFFKVTDTVCTYELPYNVNLVNQSDVTMALTPLAGRGIAVETCMMPAVRDKCHIRDV